MAKFKVGQRVKIDRKDATITKTNAEGHWDYYYFKFDGDPRERGIHESEISANSSACNARGKLGDGWAMISREKGQWYYSWATGSENGTEGPFRSEDEATIAAKTDGFKISNSRACNSVRGNTKLKNIDYWFTDNGYGDDTLIKYVPSYKKNKCIDFVDRYADTYARDKFYDAMYKLTGIKNRWALNSRVCNSSNPVVRKAMNASTL